MIDDARIIVRARHFASDYFRKHKDDDLHRNAHPSHLAAEALAAAGKKFGIGYGVEGFCDESGARGISYLNMGDTYEYTILFDSQTRRFFTGCWGDVLEQWERDGITTN